MKQATKRKFRTTTSGREKERRRKEEGEVKVFIGRAFVSTQSSPTENGGSQRLLLSTRKDQKKRNLESYLIIRHMLPPAKGKSRTQVCPHHSSFSCKSRSSKGSPNSSKHQKVSTYTPQLTRLSKETSRVHSLNVKSLSTTNSKARWISS